MAKIFLLMNEEIKIKSSYKFYPVTKENWKDFEILFGDKGACAGCWCMYWRVKSAAWEKQKGDGNKRAMKKIIYSDNIPGILAYHKSEPVGWCSVAPREDFPRLDNSRILKPVDEKPVWSVVCFFIHKNYRKKGLSIALLSAAKKFVKSNSGKILEGYPVEPKKDKMPDAFAWTGISAAFQSAGFKEVARRSETRPIMRFYIK
ncbi:MAG: GNAT family N-acetyltransferase [Ignavibacteriaceae bacterium]